MTQLTQSDCVTFLSFVSALRTTENAMRSGGWMILDAAETLFLTARARVFGEAGGDEVMVPKSKKVKKADSSEDMLDNVDLKMEVSPKWRALEEVLEEAKNEVKTNPDIPADGVPAEKILILTADERTASQLQDLLTLGHKRLMARTFNKALGERYGRIPGVDAPLPIREVKHKGVGKKSTSLKSDSLVSPCDDSQPLVLIQATQSTSSFELGQLLSTFGPRFVVLYDIDVAAVRTLEIYSAQHPEVRRILNA